MRGKEGAERNKAGVKEEEPIRGDDKFYMCSLAAAYEYENAK